MIHYGCKNVPGWDTNKCCISCHEDYEEMNYPLCNHIVGDNEYEEICCTAAQYLTENSKDVTLYIGD